MLLKLSKEKFDVLAAKLERGGISLNNTRPATHAEQRVFYSILSDMGYPDSRAIGKRAPDPNYSELGFDRVAGAPTDSEIVRYAEVTNGGTLTKDGLVTQALFFDSDLIADRYSVATYNLLVDLASKYIGRGNDFNHEFDARQARARIIQTNLGTDPATSLHPDTPVQSLKTLSPNNVVAGTYVALYGTLAFPKLENEAPSYQGGGNTIQSVSSGLVKDISIAFQPNPDTTYCSICLNKMDRFWFWSYCDIHGFPGGRMDDGTAVVEIMDHVSDVFTFGLVSDGAVKRAGIILDPKIETASQSEATDNSEKSQSDTKTEYQWTIAGPNAFRITGATVNKLPPGLYKITQDFWDNNYFELSNPDTDSLIKLPNTAGDKAIAGIRKFWKSEGLFKAKGHLFKRGVLLWGPPGGGKTAIVNQLSVDLISEDGIVLWINNPKIASAALPELRKVETTRPIICILEDIDEITGEYKEHELLSLLDGENQVNNVVFIATTNYPEKLDARMINRPSRFDEIIRVGMPSPKARSIYIRSRLNSEDLPDSELTKWVVDTKGFSIAHIKELVVSVKCLGNDYETTLTRLKGMSSKFNSNDEYDDEEELAA